MKVISVPIKCQLCSRESKYDTRYVPGYDGAILKSFWCKNCGEAQVVRFKIVDGEVEVTERIEASTIYVSEKPELGITIRPKMGNLNHQ